MEDEYDAPVPQSRTAFVTRLVNQVQLGKKLLLKYWWIPSLCIVLGVAVESLVLKQARPQYVSTGRMIVNARLSIPTANVYNEELNNFYGTQEKLMQSDSVRKRVRLRLRAINPDWSREPVAIEVGQSPKTSIFNLQAKGSDADCVQAYLQATMEEYVRLKKDLMANTTTATQSGMEEELRQMGAELQASKQAVLDFQTSNSVVLLEPNGGNNAAEYLLQLKHKLDDANSDLYLLKTLTLDQNLERLQGAPAKSTGPTNGTPEVPTAGMETAGGANLADLTPPNLGGFEEDYLQTKQRLIIKQAKLQMEDKDLNPNALERITLEKELADLEMKLAVDRQQSQEQLTNRQHTLELTVANLTNQVAEWERKALEVSQKLSDFGTLKENEKRLQTMYDQVQANLQTLDLNKGIGQESVSILEPAAPSEPVPPAKQKHLAMAGLIGGMLGAGILVFLSLLNDRPSTFSELEQLFDLPILGQIPLIKSGDAPPVLSEDDQRYPLVESYRSLRSAFLYKDAVQDEKRERPKMLVIASAYPAEGKSTTAANFAITLAQAGARVLLVDADLHRGLLHEQFATAVSPGLAEVFAGQCAWNETVVETPISNLWLLPRGTVPRQAGNLFARCGRFLTEARRWYDYCIFDSAPVMMSDDVLTLAPQTDGR